MTTMQRPSETAAADSTQPEAVGASRRRSWRVVLLGVLFILVLFAGTYAFGWLNAYRLSQRFMEDADRNYAEGNNMLALTGREAYDADAQQYVRTGGYLDVERIWSHRYSWPNPDIRERAQARARDIIYEGLTINEAEQYIQANIGRQAPYFGEIYLHLGELYRQDGDERSAREIYESVPELFPRRADLIAEAQERLERLEE